MAKLKARFMVLVLKMLSLLIYKMVVNSHAESSNQGSMLIAEVGRLMNDIESQSIVEEEN